MVHTIVQRSWIFIYVFFFLYFGATTNFKSICLHIHRYNLYTYTSFFLKIGTIHIGWIDLYVFISRAGQISYCLTWLKRRFYLLNSKWLLSSPKIKSLAFILFIDIILWNHFHFNSRSIKTLLVNVLKNLFQFSIEILYAYRILLSENQIWQSRLYGSLEFLSPVRFFYVHILIYGHQLNIY